MSKAKRTLQVMTIVGISVASTGLMASEREEMLELKNTITNLIGELVEVGVIDEQKAELMKQTAAAKAKVQARKQLADERKQQAKQALADEKDVRVQYVPDHVKQEIRDQVRAELRNEVVGDVMAQAKNERWGVPNALPEWVSKIKWNGSLRLRAQGDYFSEDTVLDADNDGFRDLAPDFLTLNESQLNVAFAGIQQNPDRFFENRQETRNRVREQVRLGVDAEVTSNLKFSARISTGRLVDPVSTNQTMGNDGERYDLQLDRAYLKYTSLDEDTYPWMTLQGGRMKNPFVSTELIFDRDLGFGGVTVGFSKSLAGGDSLMDLDDNSKKLFLTVGAFPMDENELSAQDKWLFGAQVGSEFIFENQSSFKFALAYYDYYRMTGRRNRAQDALGNRITFQEYDYTAPGFMQGGNTLFDIRNDIDSLGTTDVTSALYALASDYNLINLTASYDWANLSPIHIILSADFVKNIGYDRKEILSRIREGGNGIAQVYQDGVLLDPDSELDERTTGYFLKVSAGWPIVSKRGDWQAYLGYKYLQRDAVLDAFTDSGFHLGGTNAKGFILGGQYGLTENTSLRGRWFSSDTIDGPTAGIDTVQIDVKAKF